MMNFPRWHIPMTVTEIEAYEKRLRELQANVLFRVTVPFLFAGKIYLLRSHINMVLERLAERRMILVPDQKDTIDANDALIQG